MPATTFLECVAHPDLWPRAAGLVTIFVVIGIALAIATTIIVVITITFVVVAYDANNAIPIIVNGLYIAGTKIGRASDGYDENTKVPTLRNAVPIINQYKSCRFGPAALPYIGDLARQADTALPFGTFGDLTTSSRYITAEMSLRGNHNIKKVAIV